MRFGPAIGRLAVIFIVVLCELMNTSLDPHTPGVVRWARVTAIVAAMVAFGLFLAWLSKQRLLFSTAPAPAVPAQAGHQAKARSSRLMSHVLPSALMVVTVLAWLLLLLTNPSLAAFQAWTEAWYAKHNPQARSDNPQAGTVLIPRVGVSTGGSTRYKSYTVFSNYQVLNNRGELELGVIGVGGRIIPYKLPVVRTTGLEPSR